VDAVASQLFRYDANNNITNIVASGRTNVWTYDAYNRVQSYRDADGYLIQYRYDANHNLTNLIYPGNRVVTYAYDALNRLTNVVDWSGRQTRFTYDLANRVTSITRPNGTQRTLSYDAAGQTTNIWERTATGEPIALFRLNWNNAERVAWEFAAPLPPAYTPPARTMTFDEDNRIATFNSNPVTHDADGNLTSGPLTNNTLATYTYDARNRLLNVGGLSYGYDSAGQRIALTNGANVTRLVVNPNAPLSQVLMRVRSGVTNYYIHGLGLLYEITETATSTNTATYHYDLRGSTIALSDGSGNVTDRVHYSPYASITFRSGTNDTPFLFNGRFGVQTDANGLLYMRARYYNPHLCRFINADPIGFAGGLNHYAYADGNPVSLMDPFGLGAEKSGDYDKGMSWLQRTIATMMIDGDEQNFQRNLSQSNPTLYRQLYPRAPLAEPRDILMLGVLLHTGKGTINAFRVPHPIAAKGGTEVVQRAMSRAELAATESSGLLRGGRSGTHYVSDAVNSTAGRAQQRLALPQTPEVRVTLEVPAGRFSPPSRVQPNFNMPGGGMERTASGNVPVRVLRVDEY